jgi:ubiquinone/menaquinone biosynthesis C-methylase UbiE
VARSGLPDNFYEQIRPRLYRRIGKELRLARRVLDLGCGCCDLVKYLVGAYDQQVTGVDISSRSFPSRRRLRDGAAFHCLRRNAASLPFAADQSLDAVVMVWALHEMQDPHAILSEARRVLRPGGEVLIVEFPADSLARRLWNEDYYRPDEIRGLLADSGFADTRVRLIEQEQVTWARAFRPAADRT